MRTASSRAPASTWGIATSDATSGPRTRSISTTSRGRSSAGPRCGRCTSSAASSVDGSGYRVVFDRIHQGRLVRGEESAAHVFLAAGSLGSTELLLRCRDEHGTLPAVSRVLGQSWSANANVLSMATYADGSRVQQTLGPTISGVLDFMDRSANGQQFVIEDDGFPNLLLNSLRACLDAGTRTILDGRCSSRSRSTCAGMSGRAT